VPGVDRPIGNAAAPPNDRPFFRRSALPVRVIGSERGWLLSRINGGERLAPLLTRLLSPLPWLHDPRRRPWVTCGVSRSERDGPVVDDGCGSGSRCELPAAPACVLEGSGPSGDLEGRVYAQAVCCAVLVVRMNGDRPAVKAEHGVLGDDVAGPTGREVNDQVRMVGARTRGQVAGALRINRHARQRTRSIQARKRRELGMTAASSRRLIRFIPCSPLGQGAAHTPDRHGRCSSPVPWKSRVSKRPAVRIASRSSPWSTPGRRRMAAAWHS